MRSAPPLATTRPAYITFIREEIAKLGANICGFLGITKNYLKRKKQEKGDKRELRSQLGSAEMTHSQTNRHEGLRTHQLVLSSPVMSPGRNEMIRSVITDKAEYIVAVVNGQVTFPPTFSVA